MCGILGQIAFDTGSLLSSDKMNALNATLSHRGPDGGGLYRDSRVNLANRRLAIVDLLHGSQPLISPCGRYVLVFNGEIYNFRDLRNDLIKSGYIFRTTCDTEVLLYAWMREGLNCLNQFNGMFSFSIWDKQTQELFIVRDRMGEKPLYYAYDKHGLMFASTLLPLCQSGLFELQWDLQSIHEYLAFWYIPQPRTIFKSIQQLMPGHYIHCKGNDVCVKAWWEIPNAPESQQSEDDAIEEITYLLDDAVKLRLKADVKTGIFLSGGIDSGLITSFAQEHCSNRIQTFAIGFKEAGYSEIAEARLTAASLGVDFLSVNLDELSGKDINQAIEALDEPLGNASFIAMHALSKFTRQSVKVVLSGDGGDELFGGYPTYQAAYYKSCWDRLGLPIQKLIKYIADRMPVTHRRISLDYKLKQLMKGINLPLSQGHYIWREVMSPMQQEQGMKSHVRSCLSKQHPAVLIERCFEEASRLSDINKAMYADLKTFLLNDHLRKVDQMTMAFGLEARLPFLDHRIVDFAIRLNDVHKVNMFQTKIILRRLASGRLPRSILSAKKKGLTPPIAHWITRELKEYTRQSLEGGLVAELFSPDVLQLWFDEHQRFQHDHSRMLWGLVVLNQWSKHLNQLGVKVSAIC